MCCSCTSRTTGRSSSSYTGHGWPRCLDLRTSFPGTSSTMRPSACCRAQRWWVEYLDSAAASGWHQDLHAPTSGASAMQESAIRERRQWLEAVWAETGRSLHRQSSQRPPSAPCIGDDVQWAANVVRSRCAHYNVKLLMSLLPAELLFTASQVNIDINSPCTGIGRWERRATASQSVSCSPSWT